MEPGVIAVAILLLGAGLLFTVLRPPWPGKADDEQLMLRYGGAPSRWLKLRSGTMVHYRDHMPSGGSPDATLVLLHGGSSSLFTWNPWVLHLSGSMRIITVDLPGHGLTGATVEADYSVAGMVEFIHSFTRALGLTQPFVLAGNSTGGQVAWRFALARPRQLAGLVLVAPGGVADPGGPQARALSLMRKPGGARLLRALLSRRTFAAGLKAVVNDPNLVTDSMVERAWALNQKRGNFDAMVARYRTPSFDPALVARLGEITLPTLILWGCNDVVFPFHQSDEFMRALPHAKLVAYERCGHWPMEELPARSAEDLRAFVGQLPRL